MGMNYSFVSQRPKISSVHLRIFAAAVQLMLNTVSLEFLFSTFCLVFSFGFFLFQMLTMTVLKLPSVHLLQTEFPLIFKRHRKYIKKDSY